MQITKEELQKGIRRYTKILRSNPELYQSIEQTISDNEPVAIDTRLYLHTFAPAIIAFTTWVIDEAVKRGKNRIYFLSRDGYQMYIAAKKIIAYRKIDIKCKYLHVSRYSMKIPTYHMNIDKSIDSICTGGIDVTLDKILMRAAITDKERQNIIDELSLSEIRDAVLNYQQIIRLREKLKQSKLLRIYIEKHSLEAYQPAIDYLKQEGLCQDDKYMLVDSGWIGTLQQSIERMVHSICPDIKIEGCYFGMYEIPSNEISDKYHCFYFGSKWGLWRKIHFSNSLFETVVSSDEGMTVGYRYNNDRVECIQSLPNANGDMHKRSTKVLTDMIDRYMKYDNTPNISLDLVRKVLSKLMSEPMLLELAAYADKLFSDDVTDKDSACVAGKLSEKDIHNQRFIKKICIIKELVKETIHESAWLEGSAARLYIEKPHKALREYRHIRIYKCFVYARKQITGD